MVVADLHVHTTNSDGTLTLDRVPAAAREAGVSSVAITDHDRTHPGLDAPVSTRNGIEVIHGIELRVDAGPERLDLLGYGVRETPALRDLVDSLQDNRKERAQNIVDCVESQLGVTLDIEIAPGVGRPHIARAIERSDAPHDYQDAFDDLIGNGCPCYVARDIPDFEVGRRVLGAACDVVGLAHPLRYDDIEHALSLAAGLDAIEVHYPYGGEVDTSAVADCAAQNDLLVTGGTDAHEEQLGLAGLSRDEFEQFRAALSV